MIKVGSLFDGIGGWLLAATHSGAAPTFSCEIDPFPASVSHAHFPDVIQYGDVAKVKGDEIEPVDIICAGSPCQDLSVAGERKGLSGNRSSLFYEALRIVREMREKTNGLYPKFFIWENVTGAFSSNGRRDFQTVLYILKDDGEGNYTGNYGHGSKHGWETKEELYAHGCASEWIVKIFWANADCDEGIMIWLGVQNGKGKR